MHLTYRLFLFVSWITVISSLPPLELWGGGITLPRQNNLLTRVASYLVILNYITITSRLWQRNVGMGKPKNKLCKKSAPSMLLYIYFSVSFTFCLKWVFFFLLWPPNICCTSVSQARNKMTSPQIFKKSLLFVPKKNITQKIQIFYLLWNKLFI